VLAGQLTAHAADPTPSPSVTTPDSDGGPAGRHHGGRDCPNGAGGGGGGGGGGGSTTTPTTPTTPSTPSQSNTPSV
jgi:hypothetical protein